jgi:hypothetical protein
MAKTKTEKIADIQEQIVQLENKQKKLIQEQKLQESKARTKRLCKRMGLIESLLPETIPLTDEQFKTFLDKAITTEHSRRILAGLTAQNAATDAPQAKGAAERDNPTHAAGSAETAARAGGTATAGTTGAAQGERA